MATRHGGNTTYFDVKMKLFPLAKSKRVRQNSQPDSRYLMVAYDSYGKIILWCVLSIWIVMNKGLIKE